MARSVAIIGRPNVGKSTLFNRLVGKRLALVDDKPGVTRDWRQGEARLGDLEFVAFDTAGLEEKAAGAIAASAQKQTEQALDRADLLLFVFDAKAGITTMDRHFADWLRRRPQTDLPDRQQGRGTAERGRARGSLRPRSRRSDPCVGRAQ